MSGTTQSDDTPKLSAGHFSAADIESALEDAEKKDCLYYYPLLFAAAEHANDLGDYDRQRAFKTLGHVCTMALDADSKDEPLKPRFTTASGRSASVDDFADEDVIAMAEGVSTITDPELRARIADLVWIRLRQYQTALVAISAYLDTAEELVVADEWLPALKRAERAMNLAAMLGSGAKEQFAEVCDFVAEFIASSLTLDVPGFRPSHAMELLLKFGRGDAQENSRDLPNDLLLTRNQAEIGTKHGHIGT